MKNFEFYLYFFLAISVISFSACNDDDAGPENDEEVITTLIYTLTPDDGTDPVVYSFQDVDGDGGNMPIVVGFMNRLKTGVTYTGTIELLNESETPVEDITAEIREEDEEHQFFFSFDGGAPNISLDYADQDANGDPVGLATTLTAIGASSGALMITLRHQPNKGAAGVAQGDIANAGGETDIEVNFFVTVE